MLGKNRGCSVKYLMLGKNNECSSANIDELVQLDSGTLRRGGVRRWTSLKQHPKFGNEPLSETGTSTSLSTPSSTANTSPLPATSSTGEVARKSNWQVIEHFGSKEKGKKTFFLKD
ncbi:hypothetical protein NQ317_015019 [Molorchus minor]|uniref:Uncharacterized protein n=1 Tax=Molorchus minor TaxID=1323400 RepID=A0ABQ9K4G2_9CUCU|nr:hypothetical protein NQ317_015019 [Molorchus minor]